MSGPMPMVLGYQQLRLGSASTDLTVGRTRLTRYCETEGYALRDVFVDRDPNKPCGAMATLIAVAQKMQPAAIVVPSADDLGVMPRVREATRQRIVREAGCPVLVAG